MAIIVFLPVPIDGLRNYFGLVWAHGIILFKNYVHTTT